MLIRTLCAALVFACCGAMGAGLPGILPPAVDAALARAKIPHEAVALLVLEAEAKAALPRLAHRSEVPMNPASVMKLATTFAALELLGPAYVWTTPVYVDGSVRDGTLTGNVYIQGQGDPKLVLEQLWLLLRRLQGLGIRQVVGDIVLDHSAFALPDTDPASFDGEPLRPYNAAPDALLVNYRALALRLTPDLARGSAQVQVDPPLFGVKVPASVPLSNAACGDYRSALQADFSDPNQIRLAGTYAASCGTKVWPIAYSDPRSYAARAVWGLWLDMGGRLSGTVRDGAVPAQLLVGAPTLELVSAPLAEIIRDINKYSNNVMAQQLFLTLGRRVPMGAPGSNAEGIAGLAVGSPSVALGTASFAASQAALERWWRERMGEQDLPLWENGSGLSRQERISAQGLARMLQRAWRSPTMPEFISSLPISGVDGTLKRAKTGSVGSAHLKTGSLSNVQARAGYVLATSGKRYVLVALINHANANTEAARAAMEALVDWAVRDD